MEPQAPDMTENARRNAEKLHRLERVVMDLNAEIVRISKQNEALQEKIPSTMWCVTRKYSPDIRQSVTRGEPTRSGPTSDKDHKSGTVSHENCLRQEVTEVAQIQLTQTPPEILEQTNCLTLPSSSSAVIEKQPDGISPSPRTPMLIKENVSSAGLLEEERKPHPVMPHNKQQGDGTWAADDKVAVLRSQEADTKNSMNISLSNVKESGRPKVTTAWAKDGVRGNEFVVKDTDQNDSNCNFLWTEFVDKCSELRDEHEGQRLMDQDLFRSRTTYGVLRGSTTYFQRQHSCNVEVPRSLAPETEEACAHLLDTTRDDPGSGQSCNDKLEQAEASQKDIERLVQLLYKGLGVEHHQKIEKNVEDDVRKENEELRKSLSAMQYQLALKTEELLTASNKLGNLYDSLSPLQEAERQSAQVIAGLQEEVRQAQEERDNMRRHMGSFFGVMQSKIHELKSLMCHGEQASCPSLSVDIPRSSPTSTPTRPSLAADK